MTTPTRDELRCLICLKPGVAFHHVKPRSTAPEARDDPRNIVPVCPDCHDMIHDKVVKAKIRFATATAGVFRWKKQGDGRFDYSGINVEVVLSDRHKAMIYIEDAPQDPATGRQINETDRQAGEVGVGANPPRGGRSGTPKKEMSPGQASQTPKRTPTPTSTVEEPGLPSTVATYIRETSLELPLGLSFDDWAGMGKTLSRMYRSVGWWIGDWYIYGENRFSEEVWQVADDLGVAHETITDWVRICSQYPPEVRSEDLSISHYRTVIALPPAERAELLIEAAATGMNVRELRAKVGGEEPAKVRRWTLEELRAAYNNWQGTGGEYYTSDFLDWLEGQR